MEQMHGKNFISGSSRGDDILEPVKLLVPCRPPHGTSLLYMCAEPNKISVLNASEVSSRSFKLK